MYCVTGGLNIPWTSQGMSRGRMRQCVRGVVCSVVFSVRGMVCSAPVHGMVCGVWYGVRYAVCMVGRGMVCGIVCNFV